MRPLRVLGILSLVTLSACGNESRPTDSPGSDLGTSPPAATSKLYVDAHAYLIDHAATTAAGPDRVRSSIWIRDGFSGSGVAGATVTIANKIVPPSATDESKFYFDDLIISPGSHIDIVAKLGSQIVELSFVCPDDVTILTPAEGASFSVGDTVAASSSAWPGVGDWRIFAYDWGANRIEDDSPPLASVSGTSSTTLTLPQQAWLQSRHPNDDGLVLELMPPPTAVDDDSGSGVCQLVRRVHLKRKM